MALHNNVVFLGIQEGRFTLRDVLHHVESDYCSVKIMDVRSWMQDTGCTMQDRNGQDSDYRVLGTRCLAPSHYSPLSNLNKA